MKRGSQQICAATHDGHVHFLDPATCKVIRTWKAHSGWINDMDVRSDLLVTCGYSPRQQHGFALDHLVNVFNLKILHPLPPVAFPPGAAFVRMHPRMSTTCLVASSGGLIYAIDLMNPDSPAMRHANIFDTHLTAMDLAPSGEALALADAQCAIHLWGSPAKIQFTEYATPTEFPDTPAPVPNLDFSPEMYVDDLWYSVCVLMNTQPAQCGRHAILSGHASLRLAESYHLRGWSTACENRR